MLVGSSVSFVANSIVGIGFYIRDVTVAGKVLLYIGVFLFIINFGLTLGPVIFIYIPEVVDQHLISYAIAAMWIASSLAITLFPIIT